MKLPILPPQLSSRERAIVKRAVRDAAEQAAYYNPYPPHSTDHTLFHVSYCSAVLALDWRASSRPYRTRRASS